MENIFDNLRPLRLFLSTTAYALMASFTIIFLVVGGMILCHVGGCYGWLLRGNMEFSSEWTSQQRDVLNRFERALRFDNGNLLNYVHLVADCAELDKPLPEQGSFTFARMADEQIMPRARRLNDLLRDFTQDNQSTDAIQTAMLAQAAAEMGHGEALRLIVGQGDKNCFKQSEENILAAVFINRAKLPIEEVFEQANWLVENGADCEPCDSLLDAITYSDDSKRTLDWLLSKGMSLTIWSDDSSKRLPLDSVILRISDMKLLDELVKESKINLNSREAKYTYLQSAVEHSADPAVVEYLLQAGAQPDLLPLAGENKTPAAMLIAQLTEITDCETCFNELTILELLLEHGAVAPVLPEEWCSQEVRHSVEQVYRNCGHTVSHHSTSTSTT